MKEKREKRKRWIQRGEYVVHADIEVVYPVDSPDEACLEPKTVRRIEAIAKKAAVGDLKYLKKIGPVYQLVKS